jgi:hypothetical protein
MIQILIHLWGDYLTQSDWMAQNKTKAHLPALVHALVYSLPFFIIGSWKAIAVIAVTHFFIDRYRLARYIVWAKNLLGACREWPLARRDGKWVVEELGPNQIGYWAITPPFRACEATGYPPTTPPWLAFWLLIIADNTLHLTINYLALRWL